MNTKINPVPIQSPWKKVLFCAVNVKGFIAVLFNSSGTLKTHSSESNYTCLSSERLIILLHSPALTGPHYRDSPQSKLLFNEEFNLSLESWTAETV